MLSLCSASAKKRKMFVEAKTETINSYILVFWSLGLYKQDTGMHFNEPSVDVRLSTICSAIIMCGLYRVPAAHGLTI